MPLTDRDVERRLDRNENDILELYTMVRDVQRTVKAHDQRFDAIDGRLDAIDGRLGGIDGRLDRLEASMADVVKGLSALTAAVGRLG